VPTNNGYTFADPWLGEQRELATDVKGVLAWDAAILLWADDQLKSFSAQWETGHTWGNAPVATLAVRDTFLVEDADGIHNVKFDRDSLEIEAEDVLPDVCHLQRSSLLPAASDGFWVAAQQPCDNPKPSLLYVAYDTFEILSAEELPFEADARNMRVLIGGGIDDEPAPIAATYATDVDDDGFGTLWAWRAGDEAPIELGEHGDVDSVYLSASGMDWAGGAQTNLQSLGGRRVSDYVRFRWTGETSVFVERVLANTNSGESLINFDGTAGDLARFDGDEPRIIAQGVPPNLTMLTSYSNVAQVARMDHFDGSSGRLLLGTNDYDLSSWKELGSHVAPQFVIFSWFMPAVLFLDDWDQDSLSGTLVAYNYELDARSTIAEGVTSFDMTSYPLDGVVYAVPRGNQRGMWFSKAK
ncbi:MAG TPA: hypothetical protein VEQ58_02995, partial [Polyangiaceae bacterium]|nr:hypothetical protein [Polyangiaceae bacterium]